MKASNSYFILKTPENIKWLSLYVDPSMILGEHIIDNLTFLEVEFMPKSLLVLTTQIVVDKL